MASLQKRGRVWPAHHLGSLPPGKPNVAITFDDAYVSVAENALPELRTHQFQATIFVPAESLGRPPRWSIEDGNLDADETVMSAEQIRALPSSLVTLGSHTNTHPHLSQIDQDTAQQEIEGSRRALQTLTGNQILHLAFPYGDHDASTVELCKAAGYSCVFSVVPNAVDTENSGFVRGRVKTDPFDWPLEFFLKYHGAYGWISEVSAFKGKIRNWRRGREVRRPSYGHLS
jgi:peptidoglycan/xylan/chitin deacetylase (PgdA/CDA1 family)